MKVEFKDELSPALLQLSSKIVGHAEEAAAVAGLAAIEDAGSGHPRKPPIDRGDLRASWFVYAGSGSLRLRASGSGSPPTIQGSPGSISTAIGYNSPYAIYQHEKLRPEGGWYPRGKGANDPTVGGGWLREALSRNASRYAEIFARSMERLIRRGK